MESRTQISKKSADAAVDVDFFSTVKLNFHRFTAGCTSETCKFRLLFHTLAKTLLSCKYP